MSVLVIYTNNFPYGNAETFLESEITCLSGYFEEIIIVPFRANGKMRNLPGNVKVLSPVQSKSWSRFKIYLTGLMSFSKMYGIPELKKELRNYPLSKCLRYLGTGMIIKKVLEKNLSSEPVIHYSYWLNFSAFSLSLLKAEGKLKTLISRAHGYDLYDERGERGLSFIKEATVKNLDRVYFISDHGRNYLLKKFPQYSDKFSISRLGTADPEFINSLRGNDTITIVSCSAINKNKRIDLILESLIEFKSRFPEIALKWYHLGSGEEIGKYVERANISFKNSLVQCYFPGHLTNPEIFRFYKSKPVDLFLNVSEYEGVPVSVMEAQSFGIPVIATAVGGTPEIVNEGNGYLLPENPSPYEIASAIYDVVTNKKKWEKKRMLSRKNWEDFYSAERNYKTFAAELLNLFNKADRSVSL